MTDARISEYISGFFSENNEFDIQIKKKDKTIILTFNILDMKSCEILERQFSVGNENFVSDYIINTLAMSLTKINGIDVSEWDLEQKKDIFNNIKPYKLLIQLHQTYTNKLVELSDQYIVQ